MLELYEATYMRVQGEVILDEAFVFTSSHLEEISKDPLRSNSTLSSLIQATLKLPLWKSFPRLEALHSIPFYQKQASHNESLLKLAKLGFNLGVNAGGGKVLMSQTIYLTPEIELLNATFGHKVYTLSPNILLLGYS
ncbi:Terpene synthase, N-terminal domain-containing protein [Cynara cardunculus var. scolymus]|uniref:Terpene synthase, N-terminal domain-containing protein n=1 Tax=Cynara cardunculus var. scolymus TaxID=59895 RepID=A0A103VIN5_CYNCS|nr:Terpene synthase, N-terminal domain-containing protein [Cynara cardunculus var. scolymus]